MHEVPTDLYDGPHIVRVIETDHAGTLSPPINVVINWFEELNARVAAG